MPNDCPGPLIWFSVGCPEDAGILECAACSYVIVTGNFNDQLHVDTPMMREGL